MKYDIEQLLEAGEVIQIYPEGYSMYPMFVPGRDAAVIKKADVKKIRRADVVLYRRKGSILVLHRVVKRKGGQFYMAGDNQTEVEGPVEEDQIRGILTAFVRNGRRISVKKSGLYDLVRIVADVSAGERDILVIYCMGAQEELIFFDDYAKIRKLQ